jgi:hypothetical protein
MLLLLDARIIDKADPRSPVARLHRPLYEVL